MVDLIYRTHVKESYIHEIYVYIGVAFARRPFSERAEKLSARCKPCRNAHHRAVRSTGFSRKSAQFRLKAVLRAGYPSLFGAVGADPELSTTFVSVGDGGVGCAECGATAAPPEGATDEK